MEEAKSAYEERTYPVGSVIVDPSGQIIGRGRNDVYSGGDFTAHAEVKAICAAGARLMTWWNFETCTLYTTMEPCLMCCGAILLACIARVVWVRDDDMHGALRCLHDRTHPLSDVYVEKLRRLEIARCGEGDLRQQMERWMEHWNGQKETVLGHWRLGRGQVQGQNCLV
jgi:tRNA(adenine34) deaminase